MPLSDADLIAIALFFIGWAGYTLFAKFKAKTTDCLARCLNQHRIIWMRDLLTRDFRVGDIAILANLERNIAFFASSTLLIIAGLLTLFAQIAPLEHVLSSLSFSNQSNEVAIQIKLMVLTLIFVVAFFQFTWSMRQYGFLNVMIGAAPHSPELSEYLDNYALQMSKVQDQAAHSYNYGLRSYYFALAAICWFFHPVMMITATFIVVYTLYFREFKSKSVLAINFGQLMLKKEGK